MSAQRLLILGGTGEAAVLARAAIARFGDMISVTTALAGRTSRPGPIPGQVRIGGFGGAGGLAAYLAEQGIDRVIDATHPFAVEISAHARRACERTGVPRLMLLRPAWRRHPLDRWIEVETLDAAATLVGRRPGYDGAVSGAACRSAGAAAAAALPRGRAREGAVQPRRGAAPDAAARHRGAGVQSERRHRD
jgi:hypothetical protein